MFGIMSAKWVHIIGSSFGGVRCCDDGTTQSDPSNPVGWRALVTSLSCLKDGNNHNTGVVHVETLQQYYLNNGNPTGVTKANLPSDADFIADYVDNTACAYGSSDESHPVYLSVSFGEQTTLHVPVTATLSSVVADDVNVTVRCNYDDGVNLPVTTLAHITITAGNLSGMYSVPMAPVDYDPSHLSLVITVVTPTVTSDGKTLNY